MTVHSIHNKRWRLKYPEKWRKARNETKIRHNAEALMFANKRYLRWDSWEDALLESWAKSKTTRQIAFELGRTYDSVMMRAHYRKIKLMTPEKLTGKLTT